MTPTPGYAAGNILNMLVQLGVDLTGYDFSGLRVREAYLQEISCNNVRFSSAHLNRPRFAQTFGNVLSIAFNRDGTYLAAGTIDGDIRVWQMPDLRLIHSWSAHDGWVRSLTFDRAPDTAMNHGGIPPRR